MEFNKYKYNTAHQYYDSSKSVYSISRMKILFISRPKDGKVNPFVLEQANAIERNEEIKVDQYLIQKGGLIGYVKAINELRDVLKIKKYDLVHVHNGLSAFAVILGKFFLYSDLKVIITFHGSDINKISERYFSMFASMFSAHNILVSSSMVKYINSNYSIIPCGIDLKRIGDVRMEERKRRKWTEMDFVVLFSSGFDKKVKDPEFAHKVVNHFSKSISKKVHFLELKGYSRNEVNYLMQAADVLLMCSLSEGSPQVVKEAIWNALPVISNDVGEVANICGGVDNCFVVSKEIDSYLKILFQLTDKPERVKNRNKVVEVFDNAIIAQQISAVYAGIFKNTIHV